MALRGTEATVRFPHVAGRRMPGLGGKFYGYSGFEDGVPLFGRVVVAQAFQPNVVYLGDNDGAFVSGVRAQRALSSEGAARRSPRRSSDPLAGRCGVWGCVPGSEEPRRGGTHPRCRLFEASRDFERTPDSADGVAGAPPSAPSGATSCRSFGAQRTLSELRYFPPSAL